MLRRVEPPREALSPEQLEERGNALLIEAQRAALDAMRASMAAEFLPERGRKWQIHHIRDLRDAARRAATQWGRVDALTSELLLEIDRARAALRGDR